jgi:DNA-binding NarL/FixJ family response regulator
MSKIRVGLVDDHTIVREGFKVLLNSNENIEVVCEAGDGQEVFEMLSKSPVDILISDVYMPRLNGIELCSELKKQNNTTPVLLLSMYNNKEYFVKAIKAGASGYLLKDCEKEELCLAIKKIVNGENYFGNSVSNTLVKGLFESKKPKIKNEYHITTREKEILQLAMEGYTTKTIAERLFLSPRTVDKHRANIMEKFKVHSIVELMNFVRDKNIPLN